MLHITFKTNIVMKNLRLLFCVLLAISFANSVFAGSPFTKVTTVGSKGRTGAIMFAIGPDFYMGGGIGFKDFWVYHSDSNTIRKLPDIPGDDTSRTLAVGFSIGNKGYVGLGYDGSGKLILKNDLWQFDPATTTWTQKANFIGNACEASFVFVVGNVAYIGGGSNTLALYDSFYSYNSLIDKWKPLGTVPMGNSVFQAAFTVNYSGYISTGQVGGFGTETTATYQYDTTSNTWNQKADFPGGARQSTTAMVVGNMAYVGLGQTAYTNAYNDFYSYDPALDQWAKINSFPGGARFESCAASNGTEAYFAFGLDLSSNIYNDLWRFDAPLVTGIEPIKSSIAHISIYPDPAAGYLYLSVNNDIRFNSLSIRDVKGKILKTIYPDASPGQLKIDISGFAQGVYFVNVNTGQAIESRKFIVY